LISRRGLVIVRIGLVDIVLSLMIQNPPLELSLDGSTGASDDHEVEEGGDGVWSVVGGKVVFSHRLSTMSYLSAILVFVQIDSIA